MKKLFEFKDATKIFGAIQRISEINFEIYKNDRICFIGQNGAGKTTLLNLITNEIKLNGGKITYHKDVFDSEDINFLFQENSFSINLYVKTFLKIIRRNQKDVTYFDLLFDILELEQILDNKLFELSGGEKQKLLLFQALVSQPKILILDEYSNNIDVPTFKKIKTIIFDYVNKNDVTLLMSSHKKLEMENSCNKIVFLKNGKIVNVYENKKTFSSKQLETIIEYEGGDKKC